MRRDKIVVALGSLAAAVLGFSWIGTVWQTAVFIPLPYRHMNIPAVWWLLYGSYLFAAMRLLRCDRAVWRAALFSGLMLHAQWLLVYLLSRVPVVSVVGRAYGFYVLGVASAIIAVTAFWAGRVACLIWRELLNKPSSAVSLHSPLAIGTFLAAGYAAHSSQRLIALTAAVAAVLGWRAVDWRISQQPRQTLAAWIKRYSVPEKWAIGLLVVVAFCLRLAWYRHLIAVVGYDFHSGFLAASDDGQSYHLAAVKIAGDPRVLLSRTGNPLVSSSFDPLYPLLLGFWYRLTGVHFLPAVLLQCLLGSLVIPLVYQIGKSLSNESKMAGWGAALLVAISQPLIFSSAVYGIEALFVPVMIGWIWIAVRYLKKDQPGNAVFWLGLLGGALLGLRRSAPLFLMGLLAWMVIVNIRKAFWIRLLHGAAVIAVALAVYFPLELMYLRSGQARLLPGAGDGYSSNYWEGPTKFPEIIPSNEALIRLGINPFTDLKGSVQSALQQPAAFAKAVWETFPRRLVAFFYWPPFGSFNSIALLNPLVQNPFTGFMEFYLTVAALIGAGWAVRNASSRPISMFILLMIAAQAFAHTVLSYTATIRYSVPIRPFLMIFAVAGFGVVLRYTLSLTKRS